MASREVGRPEINKGHMQARDVPVAHDKPRLNDQRKVRPHAAKQPTLGVRPTGGTTHDQNRPPLGKERMEMRHVPVKLMTEAELAEFSLPSWLGGKKQTGDKIAYQIGPQGVNLYHIKPDGSMLSVNQKKLAITMAHAYAREAGIRPTQIGELGKDINFFPQRPQGGTGQAPGGQPPGATPGGPMPPGDPSAGPSPAGPAGPDPSQFTRGPGPAASPFGQRAQFMARRSGAPPAPPSNGPMPSPASRPPRGMGAMGGMRPNPGPANGPPGGGAPSSPAAPSAPPDVGAAPERTPDGMGFGMNPDVVKQLLMKAGYSKEQLAKMTDYQIDRAIGSIRGGGESRSMAKKRRRGEPFVNPEGGDQQMAAESYMYENRGHVGKTLQAIKAMGMRGSYDRDADEFRVNHAHNKEDTAYYTNDHADAIGTARHMKAQSMSEGYPEASFDRHTAASHSSKIGDNLFPSHHAPETGKPDLNRDYAQFRDLRIEKVTEHSNDDIAAFLDNFTARLGYTPILEDEDEKDGEKKATEHDEYRDFDHEKENCAESRLPRARHRWV